MLQKVVTWKKLTNRASTLVTISEHNEKKNEIDSKLNLILCLFDIKGDGYLYNPATGEPYPDNFVKRSDYTRILAEVCQRLFEKMKNFKIWFVCSFGPMDQQVKRKLFLNFNLKTKQIY